MKKILIMLMGIIFFSLFIIGCDNKENIKEENEVLNLSVMQRREDIPIIIAKEKGFFNEQGINVELKAFDETNFMLEAIKNKEVHGTSVGIIDTLICNDNGVPITITSNSNEDLKIIGVNGINTLKEFDNKKIAIEDKYISQYIVNSISNNEKITLILEVIKQRPVELEALRSGEVAGAIVNEIDANTLEPAGIKIISDIKNDYGIESESIVFDSEFIKNSPKKIKKFYTAYNKAIDYLNSVDVYDYIGIIEGYGISTELITYLKSNYGKFQYAKEITENEFNNIVTWLNENKIISKKYKYKDITNFKSL